MFYNYFKTAWRNLTKHRFYSLINIGGLSIGLTFTLLIGAFVWGELQVNKDLKNADRQFIIQGIWKNQPSEGLTTFGPLAKALKESYPNLVANYYRWDGITSNVSKGDKAFREGLQICDSTMLKMYGFKLLEGDRQTALNNPFTAVITKEKAIKYFGKTDVIGQFLTIENMSGGKHDFMITGVMGIPPTNSITHINENNDNGFFISELNLKFFGRNMDWSNTAIVSYVELQKGVIPQDLEQPILHLVKQNALPYDAENIKPYLVSLKEYYLSANNGTVSKTLFTLSSVALFVLTMAIINFVNMAVSRSGSRMREIGVRKVLGGQKKQLIVQFLTESVLLVYFAMLVSIGLYLLTRNLFSQIVGRPIPSLLAFPTYFAFIPVVLILFIGFLAGIYPALVLSSLKSVDSLKGKLKTIKESVWLRKSLIGFQFVTAAVVLIAAIIISQQLTLFFSKNLGYNKDFVLSAQVPRDWTKSGVAKMETIRNQFAAMPDVIKASLSYDIPNGNNIGGGPVYKLGSDSTTAIDMEVLQTDENYLSVYQIPLTAGTFFDGQKSDSGKIIINQTARQQLGWKDAGDAIGQQIRIAGDPTIFTVKAVVNDFHFGPMSSKISPTIFFNVNFSPNYRYFSFKVKPGNIPSTITSLQKEWATLMPGAAFEYQFMDETLVNLYKTEMQLKKAANLATVLALIIVLLGVLGLGSLSVQKRTKEIGIRKVLGSSVQDIVLLFIKDFAITILAGTIIACPVAFLIMHGWLSSYAYRIAITPVPFAIAIVLLIVMTSCLIISQTIKAALANPVKSLRTE